MKKHHNLKILFIPKSNLIFIQNDLKILKKYFNVIPFSWNGKKDIIKIIYYMLKSDISFSWFALDHAAFAVFFSKLFRKKSVVVVGGVDVANVPELKYGTFTLKWYKKFLTKFALKNADIILPVSNFTNNEVIKIVKPKKIKVIYNGVNTHEIGELPKKKENIISTIGGATRKHYKLNGFETFAKVSNFFSDYKFVIIGPTEKKIVERLKKINPHLIFTGQIEHKKVIDWLKKSKVYCQLSYRESFGLGIAEAMCCGCIPVVTKGKTGMKEIVKDYGFYVTYDNEKTTAEMIKKALQIPHIKQKEIRENIVRNFSLEIREKKIIDLILYLFK